MEKPIITISEGKVQGTTLKSVLGQNYLAFKGIPYAQPPIGDLRFAAPKQVSEWSGIRDCSNHAGDIAMQYETTGPLPYNVIGDEDCLYLNVYTNRLGHKRPVMFYIHGGGFVEGTGNHWMYGEDYFVTSDMVLVTVNFRLGPMGFLNLGHEVAPGNQAFRDIILALKWVQRNIEAFGGDPNNVTIFGNSSGSITCHLFTLIPATKGLFHKAILQSGTAFMAKNLIVGNHYKNGFKIASFYGMKSDDPLKVVEFLRTLPGEKLIGLEDHILSTWEKQVLGQWEYGPVFDGNYTDDPIVPLPLTELLKNDADIPMIVGHTSNEALLSFVDKFDDVVNFKFYDDNIEEIVKNILVVNERSKLAEIMEDVRKFYLKNKPIHKDTVWNLINLMTDLSHPNENRKIVDLRNNHATAPTYVFNFSYLGNEPTFYQYDHGPQPLKGVAHADELSYMFNIAYMKEYENFKICPEEGSKDRLVMERFIKMWFNFAATGNPTPVTDDRCITTVWKPATKAALNYIDLGEEMTLRDDKNSASRGFYEKFYEHDYVSQNSKRSNGFLD